MGNYNWRNKRMFCNGKETLVINYDQRGGSKLYRRVKKDT